MSTYSRSAAPNSCIFEIRKSVKRFQPALPAYVGPHWLLNTCQSHACCGVIINVGSILGNRECVPASAGRAILWAASGCPINPVPAVTPAAALRNVRLEKLLRDPLMVPSQTSRRMHASVADQPRRGERFLRGEDTARRVATVASAANNADRTCSGLCYGTAWIWLKNC